MSVQIPIDRVPSIIMTGDGHFAHRVQKISPQLPHVLNFLATGIPNLDSMSNKNDSAGVEAAGEGQDGARKFSGAPERDPWSESRDASSSSSRNSESGTVTFEEELAREEEELFGKQGAGGKNGAKDNN